MDQRPVISQSPEIAECRKYDTGIGQHDRIDDTQHRLRGIFQRQRQRLPEPIPGHRETRIEFNLTCIARYKINRLNPAIRGIDQGGVIDPMWGRIEYICRAG